MTKKAAILKGFRDFLPETAIVRNRIIETVKEVFTLHGFPPIETPALEYTELLVKSNYGDEGEAQLYRFTDNGGRDVCLRYDLTVPLARVIAMNPDLPIPFKRYHIDRAWRAEKPQKGRYREFTQCDVDIVGSELPAADAECIRIDMDLMKRFNLDDRFHILVNDRRIVNGLMITLGLLKDGDSPGAKATTFMRTLDKIHKIGLDTVLKILSGGEDPVLDDEGVSKLNEYLVREDDADAVLKRLYKLVGETVDGKSGVDYLRKVLEFFRDEKGKLNPSIVVEPSIVRGLGYYTGTVFETFLDDLPGLGSVMSGGRYDGMIGEMSGRRMPAVGISFGLDRLIAGLTELGLVELGTKTTAVVLVTVFDTRDESMKDAAEIADFMRNSGIPADLYVGKAKLSKQMKYANKTGVPFVIIRGPEEKEKDICVLRNMRDGSEEHIGLEVAAERLLSVMQREN